MTILRSTRLSERRGVPDATVARLPLYVRALTHLRDSGVDTCSSEELAAASGFTSAKVRKDLSLLGTYGTRGVGYDVEFLRAQISRELGQSQAWDVVIIGAGHLGQALAAYQGFGKRGVSVSAILDIDKVGHPVGALTVRPMADLADVVASGVSMAVIATPAEAAQSVATILEEAGITSILNFAPTTISVGEGVNVRQVDVASELQILAFHEQRRAIEEEVS